MRIMFSLRAKMTLFVIITILISVGTISVISVFSIKRTSEQTAVQYLNMLCENRLSDMNEYMDSIRQSVDIVANFLRDDISVVELVKGGVVGADGYGALLEGRDWDSPEQHVLDEYLHEHVLHAEEFFSIAGFNTNNAITYYYRINPELSKNETGFWYSRRGYSDFVSIPMTDILIYDQDDVEHVGWYYGTLEKGRPSWLDPYMNSNLGEMMISYVAPIYNAGTFVGLVGMDVSYEDLLEQISELDIYDTGYAFLTDQNGTILYHPTLPMGSKLGAISAELQRAQESQGDNTGIDHTLVTYNYHGVEKKAAWKTLENGLRLNITAPVDEINADWQRLIRSIITVTLALLGIFTVVIALVMRRITEPLQKLTAAAKQISDGDYDVNLPYEGKDEVGILTNAFRELTSNLKIYINDLNSKAYKDPLTRVKNKTAFDIWVRQENEALYSVDTMVYEQFAILMFDCNMLKEINDNYGHPRGDIYLKNASAVICEAFAHSPVFRVGGDEFVVVLQGSEYQNRRHLVKLFDQKAAEVNANTTEPWEKVYVAMGLAIFNPRQDTSVESVYKRADQAMYKNKKEWKENNPEVVEAIGK